MGTKKAVISFKNEVDLCSSASINLLEDWLECTISLGSLENGSVERCHISSPALESHNENQHCWEHSHQECCAISRNLEKKKKSHNFECFPSEETATFVSLFQHTQSINADQIHANHKTQSSQALTGCSVNTMWMRVNLNLKLPYLNP